MKIKKIKSIENIGSFYKFNNNTFEFSQSNIIYALNGYGKTTLTSIFKALKDNVSEIIKGRKSLNSLETTDQAKNNYTKRCREKIYIYDDLWKLNGLSHLSGCYDIVIF